MSHTIEEIFKIEPKLRELYSRIPAMMREPVDCDPFFGRWSRIKLAFSELVGWDAPESKLPANDYNTVYREFLKEAENYDTKGANERAE